MRLWNPPIGKASTATTEPVAVDQDDALRRAYARGRRDERARRRRSPPLLPAIALTAVIGGWTLVSAALRQAAQGAARLAGGDKIQDGVTQE